MATRKLLVPPVLSCIDEFEEWLDETEIWQCFLTDMDKDKQGPTIYLSLDEKTRKTCSDLKVKDLNSENGVDILVNKLKSLIAKDIIRQVIWPMINLKLLRPIDMSMVDFINEFERVYNNIKKYEMELPSGVLANRLLKSAEISEDKQQQEQH